MCFEIGREYLNGLKHGKGKEYNPDGSISFESEYLNGKIYWKSKSIWNCKLIFEGEYLDGKYHGKGKEYIWNTGKLIFESEYLNGKRRKE